MASIVKKLRTEMGLSQEAFARKIGRSFASVRMYETGRLPPLEVLAKMLAITRTTPGYGSIQQELETLLGGMLQTADSAAVVPPPALAQEMTLAFRAGLHAMLDYVIDNGRPASVSALCENIRVYFEELRKGGFDEGPIFEYRVILPIDFGDGVRHAAGEVVQLSLVRARQYSHALLMVEETEPASEKKSA